MVTPEFVKYIGEGKSGLNYGDVVKVLTEGTMPNFLYVECSQKTDFIGDSAMYPSKLKDKNFTFLNAEEYELIKEEKKMEPLYNITTDMATFVEVTHGANKAKSKCNVECDKFDLHTGIDIAMDRLEKIEKPEMFKYVKYIGNRRNGLEKGDICKVLSAGNERCTKGAIFIASPLQGLGYAGDAQNPEAVRGHTFTYLWAGEYEPVVVHE